MLEQWVIDQLDPPQGRKAQHPADPQRMIRTGTQAVDGWAKDNGFTFLFCSGNLAPREMYENLRNDTSAKIILVDGTREKAKLPLFAGSFPDRRDQWQCPRPWPAVRDGDEQSNKHVRRSPTRRIAANGASRLRHQRGRDRRYKPSCWLRGDVIRVM
jgi:hypothetical protein